MFFDIEATGLSVSHDRIVEISYIKLYPDGKKEERTMRINPGMHISAEATAVNGINDEDVADCPSFEEVADDLVKVFSNSDIAGFNSNSFDVPLLAEEFLRVNSDFDNSNSRFIDVQNIYHKMERRNLSAAYKFYCNKDLENAHTAQADTQATYEVLLGQLERYGDELKNDVAFLSEFSRRNRNIDFAGRFVMDDAGVPTVNFGKHKGKPVADVLHRDPGYFAWVMQGDFPVNTKRVLARLKADASSGNTQPQKKP